MIILHSKNEFPNKIIVKKTIVQRSVDEANDNATFEQHDDGESR